MIKIKLFFFSKHTLYRLHLAGPSEALTTTVHDLTIIEDEGQTEADESSSKIVKENILTDGVCLFCNILRKRKHNKYVPCHKSSDESLIKSIVTVANGLNDLQILEKFNSIEKCSYFYYHFTCKQEYLKRFVRPVSSEQRTDWHIMREIHEQTFEKICEYVETNIIQEFNNFLIFFFASFYFQYLLLC